MGSLSIDTGNYKAAEAYLTRSAELEPAIDNLNDLADVLYNLGKYDEAESRVQQAFLLPEAEQSYELWDTRGVLRLQRGDLDGAEEAFQRSLSIFSEDMRVHLHLAALYQRQNKTSLAAELVRTIARNADALPRAERRQFEDLHLKVLGVRFSQKDYQ
jgi:tetratricopeptide (TPR) repeat protein